MVTVIAGKYKGRKLFQFNNSNVRPTQAKVKKSIFDILGPLNNMKVLDLYSGVGSLGIESLSRGASHLTAVEKNPSVFKILVKNIRKICDNDDDVKLHRADVDKFLNRSNQKFDLIFADPPYEEFNFFDIKESISNFLSVGGIFCMEMQATKSIKFEEDVRIKKYGNTQVIFWTLN
tara:strand:- start:131 stop:658 length:528 start_codon:yes stop_codon:yes gene_type:complete